jgi:hypothetical protein
MRPRHLTRLQPVSDNKREVPVKTLSPLWPIRGQRTQERVKVGNTVIVDGDQWFVTSVRVSTAIIERQPALSEGTE